MTRFACGNCESRYDKKHAPRYLAGGVTEYPIDPRRVCANCDEVSTEMAICLACALENNQCQDCRNPMFGVDESLLSQVKQLRAQFNASLAASRTAFAAAVAGYKDDVDRYLAGCQAAEKRMLEEIRNGNTEQQQVACYNLYLAELKALPFAQRAEYVREKQELDLRRDADRAVFRILVENAFMLHRAKRKLLSDLSFAVHNQVRSYSSEVPPQPTNTEFVSHVIGLLAESDRKEIEDWNRQGFAVGRSVYLRMQEASASVAQALQADKYATRD